MHGYVILPPIHVLERRAAELFMPMWSIIYMWLVVVVNTRLS